MGANPLCFQHIEIGRGTYDRVCVRSKKRSRQYNFYVLLHYHEIVERNSLRALIYEKEASLNVPLNYYKRFVRPKLSFPKFLQFSDQETKQAWVGSHHPMVGNQGKIRRRTKL